MITAQCQSCARVTGFKRALGWGTFFAVILTGGLWLLALPFYPKRCVICKTLMGSAPLSTWPPPGKPWPMRSLIALNVGFFLLVIFLYWINS